MSICREKISTQHGQAQLEGYLICPQGTDAPLPAVIVCHAWAGCDAFAQRSAEKLAELGYVGFAADLYGEGRVGESKEENAALMQPLIDDRKLLRERLVTIYQAVCGLPQVDADRVAAIGYCFGGLCALDLARSGSPLAAIVSFHGLLAAPEGLTTEKIQAKVLVLHGDLDPMVSSEQVLALEKELTEAGADWQLHTYGHTLHAFTNPEANDPEFGTVYNAVADRRSWQALAGLLREIF
jgi:dienelactone hydrolase